MYGLSDFTIVRVGLGEDVEKSHAKNIKINHQCFKNRQFRIGSHWWFCNVNIKLLPRAAILSKNTRTILFTTIDGFNLPHFALFLNPLLFRNLSSLRAAKGETRSLFNQDGGAEGQY